VVFAGNGKYLKITHTEELSSVTSRGVIFGAKFLANKDPRPNSRADLLKNSKLYTKRVFDCVFKACEVQIIIRNNHYG